MAAHYRGRRVHDDHLFRLASPLIDDGGPADDWYEATRGIVAVSDGTAAATALTAFNQPLAKLHNDAVQLAEEHDLTNPPPVPLNFRSMGWRSRYAGKVRGWAVEQNLTEKLTKSAERGADLTSEKRAAQSKEEADDGKRDGPFGERGFRWKGRADDFASSVSVNHRLLLATWHFTDGDPINLASLSHIGQRKKKPNCDSIGRHCETLNGLIRGEPWMCPRFLDVDYRSGTATWRTPDLDPD